MPWAATLLFTTLLCALGVAQASAQNAVTTVGTRRCPKERSLHDHAERGAIDDVIKSCELSLPAACWAWTNGKRSAKTEMPTPLASFQN